MRVLGIKPPHDGSMVFIKDHELVLAIEGEKDSHPRYSGITRPAFLQTFEVIDEIPEVIALGDECTGESGYFSDYYGVEEAVKKVEEVKMMGKHVKIFRSSHERAHLLCAYGLSPFPAGEPYYALCWEGAIGRFYYITPDLQIHDYDPVMYCPGSRYYLPYFVANPNIENSSQVWDLSMSGKMMALTGYGRKDRETGAKWEPIVTEMLAYQFAFLDTHNHYKRAVHFFRQFPIKQIGVESQDFKDFAYHYSEAIFERFYRFAKENLKEKFPLLISGGCGLNCDWNTKWKESGLFADVFVPPCPNDSGSGIGYAIDALHHFTGNAKIKWSVYAGAEFIHDVQPGAEFVTKTLNYGEVADLLAKGLVLAWVQGRYEMGPRALGNRSLIAAPFSSAMRHRLNQIKQREDFRPIAPVCTEESVSRFFDWKGASPYMLHFTEVTTPNIPAVTHVDNSARVQTVSRDQNPKLYDLLTRFAAKTGYPVLCNTSLNEKGKGFINRMSDLISYVLNQDVNGMVVGDFLYLKNQS